MYLFIYLVFFFDADNTNLSLMHLSFLFTAEHVHTTFVSYCVISVWTVAIADECLFGEDKQHFYLKIFFYFTKKQNIYLLNDQCSKMCQLST